MARKTLGAIAVGCVLVVAWGCGVPGGPPEVAPAAGENPLAVSAAGSIPARLPSRLLVGLREDTGGTWMRSSGVPWDARYMYLTTGWADNWGYGAYDGNFALNYMTECAAGGFMPLFSYYVMNQEPGGAEDQFLAKAQNAVTMKSYFSDFKLLLQRAKDFGKPVLVVLEPDGFGELELQSNENPQAPAAVASTGLPELQGLPNTVAGWGMAFLALRNAVGAHNVVLALHVSDWGTGDDIGYFQVTTPLQPVVDKAYAFLAPLGLTPNPTGATYDLLSGDPLDRDSDYYRVVGGDPNRWWDASDTATINSRSFNRYAEWLRLWNLKANRRWVLWQIPMGNANALNVDNSGAPRTGYKDNRPEYFFAGSTAHLARWAQNGVIGLFFGAGASGQMTEDTDLWTDGQPFLKTHAGGFLRAGGMPLTSGAADAGSRDAGVADAGVHLHDAGVPDAGNQVHDAGTVDTAQYNFESTAQGWSASQDLPTSVVRSTQDAYRGTHALAVQLSGTGAEDVAVPAPTARAGQTVTFHIKCPAGGGLSGLQTYVMQGAAGGWTWTGQTRSAAQLQPGAWNTFQVTVPSNAVPPLDQLGVEFTLKGSSNLTCFVDSVGW